MIAYDVVVPTAGRDTLGDLLHALANGQGPRRRASSWWTTAPAPRRSRSPASPGPDRCGRCCECCPAAARNRGWRAAGSEWAAFLDDDVVPAPDWAARLADDLAGLSSAVAGSQGHIRVPLPPDGPPTDWERNVAGLEGARWATADMAYRRADLASVGGFDERFPRAYREDADLALRLLDRGRLLAQGERTVEHPVRAASPWVSVRLQAGNADDALMRALHGSRWRDRAGVSRGRRRRHLATVAAGCAALGAIATGRRGLARLGALGWAAGPIELAAARIAPGPRTGAEVATMVATSAVIPFAAVGWWLVGRARLGRLLATDCAPRTDRSAARHAPRAVRSAARHAPGADPEGSEIRVGSCTTGKKVASSDHLLAVSPSVSAGGRELPDAVLLDRDGTLIHDVPYNGDPDRVVPVPGARKALERLREAGVPLAVVSNQSGVARGLLTTENVTAVNRRVEELLGPLGHWAVCPHGPDDGCGCRKPAPGLVLEAAAAVGARPERCVVVGDIGADVEAARAAGARGVLVPTPRTRQEEIEAAPEVAPDLTAAVELLVGGARP